MPTSEKRFLNVNICDREVSLADMRNILKFALMGTRQILFSNIHRPHGTIPRYNGSSAGTSASWNKGFPGNQRFALYGRQFCSGEGSAGAGEGGSSDSDSKQSSSVINDTERIKDHTVEDVGTRELLREMRRYNKGNEEHLETVAEMVMKRTLSGKHDESDEELMDDLRTGGGVVEDVHDSEFESDFEEANDTDHEIEDLYSARDYVEKKMVEDGTVNMTAEMYDEVIKELQDGGYVIDNKGYEEIVEDMLNWDKVLPDELKEKIEAKFNELGDMCERGEIEPEEAFELFKEFEELMVQEYAKQMPAVEIPENVVSENKGYEKDPPGEGPILRWETRVVLSPGGDAWHPANRKVKVSVYVKELGLSKYAAKRLRALVGKRYNAGKDELTIVSERFEHREENRKDVLRTLYALIEEAEKADALVAEARTAYVKQRMKANPEFHERLKAQAAMLAGTQGLTVV